MSHSIKKQNHKYRIGIDEAGRGPLAGPVSVGVVRFPAQLDLEIRRELKKIAGKDSKKLSEKAREEWFKKLQVWKKEKKLDFHVSLVHADYIDRFGISQAIRKAMKLCLEKLTKNIEAQTCLVLLDGSLKAPEKFLFQKTIIKGDEKEPVISLASIAAKVTRDKYMVKISQKYPQYGLEIHKGYGTYIHREAIRAFGPSKLHRMSFLNVLLMKRSES